MKPMPKWAYLLVPLAPIVSVLGLAWSAFSWTILEPCIITVCKLGGWDVPQWIKDIEADPPGWVNHRN